MDVLQWLNTGLHVFLTGVLALVPGTLVWMIVLAIYLLVKNLGQAPWRQGLRSE
jgi:hypothetical protein